MTDEKHQEGSLSPQVKTWLYVGTIAASIFVWGIRLEERVTAIDEQLDSIQRTLSVGMLPRSDERFRSLEREIATLQRECVREQRDGN